METISIFTIDKKHHIAINLLIATSIHILLVNPFHCNQTRKD
ncbi:MAG: hypothetical protein ACXW07_05435 [Nitrososphaeraceae archaeon]